MEHSKKTLLILAGGLGSRYNSLKQVDVLDSNGVTLLEFSIYDALLSGFNKIVLIVNRLIPEQFLEKLKEIAKRKAFEIHFVFQEKNSFLPNNPRFNFLDRQKPWGTAHAILCAKSVIAEPFMVVNADDFYGKSCYQKFSLALNGNEITERNYQMIGFSLNKTISPFGTVSRGICSINPNNELQKIEEHTDISRDDIGIYSNENNEKKYISAKSMVSMNCWLFHPSVFDYLEQNFIDFLETATSTSEFFIPSVIQKLINENKILVNVKTTTEQWLGMTYPEDKKYLQEKILQMVDLQNYPKNLWNEN